MRRRRKRSPENPGKDDGHTGERREAENAFRGEEYFRALVENATDVITVLEEDGTIRYESPSVRRCLGWDPEELVGQNVFEYLHPEDASVALEAFKSGLQIPGNSSYMEVRFRHKDGSWRWFGGIGRNLLQDEVVHGILLNSHDITERMEAERELVQNRRTLMTLLGNLPGMVYRCRNDRDWTSEFVSEGCLELTGYQPDDLIDNRAVSYGGLIHPDDREHVWNAVQEALLRQEPFEITYRIRMASGEEKWVWEQGRGVFSPRGELQALEGFISDITARIGAERLLRVQRDLAFRLSETFELEDIFEVSLRAVMEISGMDCGAIYLLDEATGDMRIAYHTGLSDAFVAEVAGYDASSPNVRLVAAGRPLYREHGEFHYPLPEGSKAEGIRSDAIVPILFEGEAIGCLNVASHVLEEIPGRSRDAVEVLAAMLGQAVTRAGLVSALRESEERYRLLYDHAGEAIFTYDPDLKVVNVNRLACEKIGYAEEELLGRNILELGFVLEEDLEKAWREVEALLKGEKRVASEVIRLRRKDGKILVADMTGAALYDKDGRLIGVSNIVMDITESQRAESLTRAQLELAMALSGTVDLDEVFAESMHAVLDVTGMEAGSIYMVDENRGTFDLAYTTGHSPEFVERVRRFEARSENGRLMGSGTPVYVNFGESLPRESGIRAAEGLKAVAIVPMLSEGKVVGCICAASYVLERLDANARAATEVIAAQIGQAVERARLVFALRESEERYRLLAENAHDLIYRVSMKPGRHFEYVSPSATAITGYTPEEHYADPDLGFKMVHPDDRHLLEEMAEGEMDPESPVEFRWVRKDGSVIWTEQVNTLIYDEEGALVAIEGIARDITERKRAEEVLRESEERYRATFESTGTAMGVVEPDGFVSIVNSEFERMLGYAREEVEGKRRYWDFVHAEDVGMVKSLAGSIIRSESTMPLQYECRVLHRDGKVLSVLVNVNPLPGNDKSVVSLVDITDKKAYERRLEKNAEQLRDFLDIAAHELRHPATLLKGYAVTLDARWDDMDNDSKVASLRAIQSGADRLVYVVEELLDVSRLQREHLALRIEEAQLEGILERAVEEMRVREPGRTIELETAGDLGTAEVDADRLARLFVILIDNAVKYSPAGTAVEVRGERDGGSVTFSVLDRGVGVPEEDRDGIFDRFFQAGGALHHSGPGLGLGLYIGKRIVEAHGGRIWHDPREGGGSAFRFTLPV